MSRTACTEPQWLTKVTFTFTFFLLSLYISSWLDFVTDMQCVYSAVGNFIFKNTAVRFSLLGIKNRVVKVKVTPVQALRLCTGCTARRGSRNISLPFHDHGTRRGWMISVTPRSLFTPGKKPCTHYRGGWVEARADLDRCGNLATSGFDPRTVQP